MNPASQVLVVGGGLAGLSLALRAADQGAEVTVLAKRALTEGSSLYAQGGIAAALKQADSVGSHAQDTLAAGAGLCRPEVVQSVVEKAPAAVQWLIDQGVNFSRAPGPDETYHLTREGGHSHRRVVHAADATGQEVEHTLEARIRQHPRIRVCEHHIVIDLISQTKLQRPGPNRCLGLYALDNRTGRVKTFGAQAVVLATGGASKVYLYTSNPDTSTGDGIAIAWRAGCRVANMEFVQFHPTCLYHPLAKSHLVSEAVRGEGGHLVLADGTRFMPGHDSRAELAPRDIVARIIDFEMKRRGLDCVFLDISHKSRDFIESHFPNIQRMCQRFGYDLTRDPVPVVPAAHYTCGGIVTDLNGRTDLPGLYAVGESACTGLHGANRLASNSLLECLVFGTAAARDILQRLEVSPAIDDDLPDWDESRVSDPDEQIVVSHNWDELRRFMWDYVGIVRTTKRLQRAQRRVELLVDEIREFYSHFTVTNDLVELRNLVVVAELIIRSALARHESRGLHFTRDYPETLPESKASETVLTPPAYRSVAWPGDNEKPQPASGLG